jgi:hypothetical protein
MAGARIERLVLSIECISPPDAVARAARALPERISARRRKGEHSHNLRSHGYQLSRSE